MLEDNRKLSSEVTTITRGMENSRGLIDMLEKEKLRLEKEL
jgi:hypothetical protein